MLLFTPLCFVKILLSFETYLFCVDFGGDFYCCVVCSGPFLLALSLLRGADKSPRPSTGALVWSFDSPCDSLDLFGLPLSYVFSVGKNQGDGGSGSKGP